MTAILKALRSPGMMLLALVLALFAQGEHTAQVFASFSHPADGPELLAYAFAGAVEVAVLLFVMNGHKTISYIFAAATFATNLVYYAIGGIDLLSVAILPVLLLSALLPGVIVGYSHTIAATGATQDAPATQQSAWRWQFWRKAAAPAAVPAQMCIDAPQPAQEPARLAPQPAQPLTPAQRRAQIREQEITDAAQIAAQFGVKLRTAQEDLRLVREAMTQQNGVH
jgi:pyruvate/2-oxoglutarate dehydrogenase complex dihydrolipoamide acyltransferase (E2) component